MVLRSLTAPLTIKLLPLLWALALPVMAEPGLLDGRRFVGLNGEQGKPLDPDEKEEIQFHRGLFTSVSCEPYNFGSAPYQARREGDTIHFEATTTSPTHGTIEWTGTIRGDSAEMIFVWTKERWYWNTRRAYWFQGRATE